MSKRFIHIQLRNPDASDDRQPLFFAEVRLPATRISGATISPVITLGEVRLEQILENPSIDPSLRKRYVTAARMLHRAITRYPTVGQARGNVAAAYAPVSP